MSYIIQHLYLLLIIIIYNVSGQIQSVSVDPDIYSPEKKRGCQIQFKPYIRNKQRQSTRALASSQTHSFTIKGQWPSDSQINIKGLTKMFEIATKYYKRVITVTPLQQGQTIYPGYSCGRQVPSQYRNQGFNPLQTDAVIIILTQNDPSSSTIASATSCSLTRWPTYGYIIFNAANIEANMTKTGIFHQDVIVTLHQLCHVFGMAKSLYNYYYTHYASGQFKTNTVGISSNGYYMIITQNVLNYVQNFFNCHDQVTGAYIEDNGGGGTAGSHWERTIYFDEFMTGTSLPQGSVVTALTLNLLKDTNYYYDVDVTYADPSKFGQNAGCSFAQALSLKSPQYCSFGQKCDFYGFFGGYCSGDSLSSRGTIFPYSNKLCTLPQKATSVGQYQKFDALSHCFDTYSGSNCFLANCEGEKVVLTIDGKNYNCVQGESIQTVAGSVQCPSDFSIFCARKKCQNWCNAQTLCILGQCMDQLKKVNRTEETPNNSTMIIAICVSIGVLLLVIVCIVVICLYRKFKRNQVENQNLSAIAMTQKKIKNKKKNLQDYNMYQNQSENSIANINTKKKGKQLLPPISQENGNRIYNPYSKFQKPQYLNYKK